MARISNMHPTRPIMEMQSVLVTTTRELHAVIFILKTDLWLRRVFCDGEKNVTTKKLS
ncbi:hypothetical protein [Ferrovum myxofaciens]|nr:hypothetical protein [Ferrovum myxofaciens]